jgi:hypothetical protein
MNRDSHSHHSFVLFIIVQNRKSLKGTRKE